MLAKDPNEIWNGNHKIPWDDPAFSKRMLALHLEQDHDLASRRLEWTATSLAPSLCWETFAGSALEARTLAIEYQTPEAVERIGRGRWLPKHPPRPDWPANTGAMALWSAET